MKSTIWIVVVLVAVCYRCPVDAIRCYSNVGCSGGAQFCVINCQATFQYCTAVYSLNQSNLQLSPTYMICTLANANDTGGGHANCTDSLYRDETGFWICTCNTDLCNTLQPLTDNGSLPTPTPSLPPPSGDMHPGVVFEKPPPDTDRWWCEYRKKNEETGEAVEGYQYCDQVKHFNTLDPLKQGCLGLYTVNNSGSLLKKQQECVSTFVSYCNETFCNVHNSAPNRGGYTRNLYCCCNTSGCNVDTPPLLLDHPVYPVNVTHVDHSEHLVCEYTNCTTDKFTKDYHCHTGVVVCSEHTLVKEKLFPAGKSHHSCYTIKRPKVDPKSNKIVMSDDGTSYVLENVVGGCSLSAPEECLTDVCALERVSNRSNYPDRYVCCCQSTLCNMEPLPPNVITVVTTTPTPSSPPPTPPDVSSLVAVVVVCVLLLLIMFAACMGIVVYTQFKIKHLPHNTAADIADGGLSPTQVRLTSVSKGCANIPCRLVEKISRGRFSDVWKADYKGELLAVKIFSHSDIQSWADEVEIYKTEHLQHPHILQFCGVYIAETSLEYSPWLICEYHAQGSLANVLERKVLSLHQFLIMGMSVASGLAHLHKLAIAHRDLKSKNVLVKSDGTCCIGDLGLALKLVAGNVETEAHGQVGTTRYMSPEVLEGAINFQSESFLRIDIYAFALILWEMTVRCSPDQEKSQQVEKYQQPYDCYLMAPPTIETMKDIVVHKNIRPEFPVYFECQKLEPIVETIRECWDADVEARLNAKTVHSRFSKVYNKFFPGYNETHTWEKGLDYDDSTKKGSISNDSNGYVSADCPSPSSFDYSAHSLNMANAPNVPTFGRHNFVPRSSTTSTLPTSPSTYASSEHVMSSTVGLLRSTSPSQYPPRSRKYLPVNETTV